MSEGASLLTYLDTPVVVGDPDGRVIYVNPAFERRFERPGREVQGELLATLFGGGAREALLASVAEVCDHGRTARFRVREGGHGFLALVSPIRGEGQQLGVIILLTDEPLAGERVLAFHREMQEPLDELRGILDELIEQTGGRRREQFRLAVEGGLRALDRARKWADELHGVLSGRSATGDGGSIDAVSLVRQVGERGRAELEERGLDLALLLPGRLPLAKGDPSRVESALVHLLRERARQAGRGSAFHLCARASGGDAGAGVVISLLEPPGLPEPSAGALGFLRDHLEALGGQLGTVEMEGLGRAATLVLPLAD